MIDILITKTVKVKWNNSNKKHYESKGYKFTKVGEEFDCRVEDIPPRERYKYNVKIKCDNCNSNEIIETSLSKYSNNLNRNNSIYVCNDCEKHKKYDKYIGQKVGRLTITKYLGHYTNGRKAKEHWFLCDCECGNKDIIKSYTYLFHAKLLLKSCGCWNTEHTIIFNKETKTSFDNEYYEKDGDYYIKAIKNNEEYTTIIDKEMFKYLKKKNRKLSIDSRGYAFISQEDTHIQMFIHNLVIFGEDYYNKNMNIFVDHINNTEIRDNRKSNLRPANDCENTQNAKKRKDNTCGIKGFTIKLPSNRPTAHITVRIQSYKNRIGKHFPLSPQGLEEAIIWNHNTRLELHGEFANFGYDTKGKTLDKIVKEQSEIFISNLTSEQQKAFYNDGYTYKPIKNKPRLNQN